VRTTLTLDEDVAAKLEADVRKVWTLIQGNRELLSPAGPERAQGDETNKAIQGARAQPGKKPG